MSAWSDLVREHHATVYRVALGVLRDSSAAEDVAQDVFLSFLRNPSAIARAGNVRALACRSALNRALDVRKAGLRRVARETAVSERSIAVDPLETVFRHELRDKVAELPEIHRQAVDLHFFQGLTIAETAQVLDVPRGTASRRLSDAIATLRKWLSAAAFVGLLAKLESELSHVEAAPVPSGLEKRLLDLPRTHGAESVRRPLSRGAKSAIAVAVAFLFAVSTGQWIRSSHGRWEGEATQPVHDEIAAVEGEAPAEMAAAPGAPSPTATCCPTATPVTEIAAVPEVEETIEGFLFRTPEGLFLAGEVVPNPGESVGAFRPYDGRLWRLSGGALDSWPACETTNFAAFLQEGAPVSAAPHTRVRLRVRSALAPQVWLVDQVKQPQGTETAVMWGVSQALTERSLTYFPAEPGSQEVVGAVWTLAEGSNTAEFAPGPDVELGEVREIFVEAVQDGDGGAGISRVLLNELQQRAQQEPPAATAATVLEVLEVESLNDSWLEAWRDLYAAASRALTQPEPEIDPAVRAADAARLGEALQRARLARAGQSPAAWRIRMEHRFAAGAVASLSMEGLSGYLPGLPTEAELRDAFLAANSPDELKALVVSRWGEDALALSIPAVLSRWDTRIAATLAPHTLAEITALSLEDFRLAVETTRGAGETTFQSW